MFVSATRYATRRHWCSYSASTGAPSTKKTKHIPQSDAESEVRVHAKNLLHSLQNYFSGNSYLVESSRGLCKLVFTLPQNAYANLTDPSKFTTSPKDASYYWTHVCNGATGAILCTIVLTGGVPITCKIPAAYFFLTLLNIEHRNVHPPNANSGWTAVLVLLAAFFFAMTVADGCARNERQKTRATTQVESKPQITPATEPIYAESKPYRNKIQVIVEPKQANY